MTRILKKDLEREIRHLRRHISEQDREIKHLNLRLGAYQNPYNVLSTLACSVQEVARASSNLVQSLPTVERMEKKGG